VSETAERELAAEPQTQPRLHLGVLAPYALPILLLAEIIVFSLLRPNTFASNANFQLTLQSVSVNAVVAVALLVPLVSGRFDLSVGSNLGFTGFIAGVAMSRHGFDLAAALALAVGIGAVIGCVNGFFVAYLRVDSLIVTLGTATILLGLTTWRSNGTLITNGLSGDLTSLGLKKVAGIPTTFLIALIVAVVVWYLLTQTIYGRYLGAIGSNESSAVLVGINVSWTVFAAFIVSGVLAAFAGVLEIANQGVADPSIGGINILLPALAGTFLSVSAFTPGRYNVPGAIVGLLFLAVAVSGLAYLGAAPWVNDVFNGIAIVLAVTLASYLGRRGHA
jgi:ribose transport system permease protein